MSFGSTHEKRQQAARKHADTKHTCPICGKVCKGNGYANHKRACLKKHASIGYLTPVALNAAKLAAEAQHQQDIADIPTRITAILRGERAASLERKGEREDNSPARIGPEM